jgi:hypothetical protein
MQSKASRGLLATAPIGRAVPPTRSGGGARRGAFPRGFAAPLFLSGLIRVRDAQRPIVFPGAS